MSRPARRVALSALSVLALFGLAGCGGGGGGAGAARSGPAGSAQAGGPNFHISGVTSLGPESATARLTAVQAVRAPGPVVAPLSTDQQAQLDLWPDACSVLTRAQIKAVIPGAYSPVPVSSYGLAPSGTGKLAHPNKCVWQLGGGSRGSSVTLSLDGQEPSAVQADGPDGSGPIVNLGDGISCQNSLGVLTCIHQSWDYSLSAVLIHQDGSRDFMSQALVTDWLQPLAAAAGSVLQGS